jgi:uncharacterized membrane protein YeaQ/YmgE (transglycosylase-associated protein family)
MGIFAWIIMGLVAGAIAKALHPGPDPGGIVVTMLVGIAGAFIGGLIGHLIFGRGITGFNISSFLLAIAGSFVLLVLYRFAVQRTRPTTRRVA